jgi:hypothetical protein
MMIVALKCSYGGEEVVGESIRKHDNIYCGEACAFEAGGSRGGNDPAASTVAVPSAERVGKEEE